MTFTKDEIVRLRLYMTELETHKELNLLNEQVNSNLKLQIEAYKSIVQAKDGTIVTLKNWHTDTQKLNDNLQEKINKQNKTIKNFPYYIGGSFIGGMILCLLLK